MSKPIRATDARGRLAELEAEKAQLLAKRTALFRQLVDGRDPRETDDLARRLISGESAHDVALIDVEAELRPIDGQIRTVDKAIEILVSELQLVDLREGYRLAAPLHRKAMSHLPRLAAALAEVKAALEESRADVAAFETVNAPLGYLHGQHPTAEKAPYNATEVELLCQGWLIEFMLGDGANPTRLSRWAEEAREFGLDVPLMPARMDPPARRPEDGGEGKAMSWKGIIGELVGGRGSGMPRYGG